jgi:hypothetical protein
VSLPDSGAERERQLSTYDERIAAWRTLAAAHRTNNATLVATMLTVGANSITAQNITDINAAIAAISTAVAAANAPLTKQD